MSISVVISQARRARLHPRQHSRQKTPWPSHHHTVLLLWSIQAERNKIIKQGDLRREILLQKPQSRRAWPLPSSPWRRHKPLRTQARSERAWSKKVIHVLPGSQPKRSKSNQDGTKALLLSQIRCLRRSRTIEREDCVPGAVRAAKFEPLLQPPGQSIL